MTPAALRSEQQELLCGLAALHCRYGGYEHARALVDLALHFQVDDPTALRVAAVVALRDGRPADCLAYLGLLGSAAFAEPDLAALEERAKAAIKA